MSEALPYIGAAIGSFFPGIGTAVGWAIGACEGGSLSPTLTPNDARPVLTLKDLMEGGANDHLEHSR